MSYVDLLNEALEQTHFPELDQQIVFHTWLWKDPKLVVGKTREEQIGILSREAERYMSEKPAPGITPHPVEIVKIEPDLTPENSDLYDNKDPEEMEKFAHKKGFPDFYSFHKQIVSEMYKVWYKSSVKDWIISDIEYGMSTDPYQLLNKLKKSTDNQEIIKAAYEFLKIGGFSTAEIKINDEGNFDAEQKPTDLEF